MIFTRDTNSEVAWLDVWIWNGSNKNCRRYRADTECGTDGQTDERTDGRGETNIPPNNFVARANIVDNGIQKMIYLCLDDNDLMCFVD